MSVPPPDPFAACADAFRSVSSVGWFAFFVLVLEAIALPGMKGGPGANMLTVVAITFCYGFGGVLLGGFGRIGCRSPVAGWRATLLQVVSWLSLVHVPFGTVAGIRALWTLRKQRSEKP